MTKKVLIIGLPGSGKTTLAKILKSKLDAEWINADKVRKKYNDWDFSEAGRLRQSLRMKDLSNSFLKKGKSVIADFICPTPKTRENFNPDIIIWVDTIKKCKFEDTNSMFVPPEKYDLRVTTKDSEKWSSEILNLILKR